MLVEGWRECEPQIIADRPESTGATAGDDRGNERTPEGWTRRSVRAIGLATAYRTLKLLVAEGLTTSSCVTLSPRARWSRSSAARSDSFWCCAASPSPVMRSPTSASPARPSRGVRAAGRASS